jgi:Ras-related protein Rab-5C
MPLERGCKVVFIGSISVGKTTLMTRMADDRFDPNTEPTTCAAYAQYAPPGDEDLLVQFWDTAGMERYKSINKIYYQDAVVALLTFDLSDRKTFADLNMWRDEFERENTLTGAVIILVGNKCDLVGSKSDLADKTHVSEEEARTWAEENGVEYFAVSAMTGEGVSELLEALVRSLPRKGAKPMRRQPRLGKEQEKDRGCCRG